MSSLNYHHLHYFWTIAREGSVAAAASRLHVTASALSIQLRQLEDRLGQPLFVRQHRRLALTEAGRIALEYADTIFRSGDELLAVLRGRPADNREIVRIGATAILSRNFQYTLLRPLLAEPGVELVLRSGSMPELLAQLDAHALDMLLSNVPVPRDAGQNRHSHLLADVAVSLVSRRSRQRRPFRYPDDLAATPVLLPSHASTMRAAFDLAMHSAGITPRVLGEIDDMAMLRLMARDAPGVTLVPTVVVRDELAAGTLLERCAVPGVRERFYAITTGRRFPNRWVKQLISGQPSAAKSVRPAA
ncbi:MAG: LysR family transcriptional regulator [Burkholderiales bacterium]|nr:LysR family transcriptional regulator [Burkholderiales bacterium]